MDALQPQKEMGLESVPVIRLGDLTPEQVKALRIADNRLALNAGWDDELLRIELSELEDFDLDILGFSLDELDALVYSLDTLDEGAFNHPSEESEEIFIEPQSSPVSRPGDVWELGPHRLLCGDSTKPEHVSEVMAGAPAALYLTDPPYNVSYTGGSTKERRAIDNYSMPAESFDAFLTAAFTAADAHKSPGSAFYIWHASKALLEFVSAYCDAIVERWERETGKKAKRIEFSSCIS